MALVNEDPSIEIITVQYIGMYTIKFDKEYTNYCIIKPNIVF